MRDSGYSFLHYSSFLLISIVSSYSISHSKSNNLISIGVRASSLVEMSAINFSASAFSTRSTLYRLMASIIYFYDSKSFFFLRLLIVLTISSAEVMVSSIINSSSRVNDLTLLLILSSMSLYVLRGNFDTVGARLPCLVDDDVLLLTKVVLY